MPDRPTTPQDPDLMIELAKRQMAKEMPSELNSASIAPMGLMDKFLLGFRPGTVAVTYPSNSIKYDPDFIRSSGYSQNVVNDILAHELTHVRQYKGMKHPYLNLMLETLKSMMGNDTPYGQTPIEMEAFQTERNRQLSGHRPSIDTIPPPEFNGPARTDDISLPPQKKR